MSDEYFRLGFWDNRADAPRWTDWNKGNASRGRLDAGSSGWSSLLIPTKEHPRMLSLGWATADARWINSPGHWPTQSLLREVLWEPRLQQLLFRPLPELAQLRGEEAKLMQG